MSTNLRRLRTLEAIWTPFRTPAMDRVIETLARELHTDPRALRDDVERFAATHRTNGSLETVAAELATSCDCTGPELMADAERIAGLARADAA